ncbi:programmed cell death protein 2 [Lampetra fluviatilis]
MSATRGAPVELGFAALPPSSSWRLRAANFPSKVGGRPAWLGRDPLPGLAEQLACGRCANTCAFLLQVYAPLPNRDDCFHRSLLLFCCRDPTCYAELHDPRCLRVVRCQLPRRNPFYSFDPPPDDPSSGTTAAEAAAAAESEEAGEAWSHRLCLVCGGPGPKACSRCHTAAYCGKRHQAMDWKAGHKHECGHAAEPPQTPPKRDHGFLFPELEILTEAEDDDDDDEVEDEQKEEEATSDAAGQGALKAATESEFDEQQLEAVARRESADDRAFRLFKERIARDPKQVLRYSREGQPLWVSSEHVATASDIPACSCGSPRSFEFQVMPQLLSELQVDSLSASIDWGTLVVYTCSRSCTPRDGPHAYVSEFVWKQDFVHSAGGLRQQRQ